jgi:Bacterial Ig-like domain
MSLALLALSSFAADAAAVQARFDLDDRRGSPFPSDRFTVTDWTQNTGLRINLPKPACTLRPNDCQNLDVINTLDGFNVQPRLSIPFDGPIDVGSVTSRTVFLVSLGSTRPGGSAPGRVVGINQVVWDVVTVTLHAESDELRDQHTRYALIVTRGLRDASGNSVEAAAAFRRFRADFSFGQTGTIPP